MAEYITNLWDAFNANRQNLSLNHWTYSAVGEWLWRNVAGLNPDKQHPGYQTFKIHPRPARQVTWCQASYDDAVHPPINSITGFGDRRLTGLGHLRARVPCL